MTQREGVTEKVEHAVAALVDARNDLKEAQTRALLLEGDDAYTALRSLAHAAVKLDEAEMWLHKAVRR